MKMRLILSLILASLLVACSDDGDDKKEDGGKEDVNPNAPVLTINGLRDDYYTEGETVSLDISATSPLGNTLTIIAKPGSGGDIDDISPFVVDPEFVIHPNKDDDENDFVQNSPASATLQWDILAGYAEGDELNNIGGAPNGITDYVVRFEANDTTDNSLNDVEIVKIRVVNDLGISVLAGRDLYNQNCASCHGPGGVGGSSTQVRCSDYETVDFAIENIGAMSGLKSLTDQERMQIGDYLETIDAQDCAKVVIN